MFCYQCEQTAKGTGCTVQGVCGKDAETAALQDLLLLALKGLAWRACRARAAGRGDPEVGRFVLEGLFSTVTNVNFDPARLEELIRRAAALRDRLAGDCGAGCCCGGKAPPAASWRPAADRAGLLRQGEEAGLPARRQAAGDTVAGLQELVLYGLKGAAAYADHALILGVSDEGVLAAFQELLAALAEDPRETGELLRLALAAGELNLKAMELLDRANTAAYGQPQPTAVRITPVKGQAILVSGHDLKDLEEVLKQTAGKRINVYTHGEMLPAHGYPGLKKFPHLAGNYGGAWQEQQREFAAFPGAILMTTNCLQRPQESYRGRLFTCGLVAWPGVRHLEGRDFAPLIAAAQAAPGFPADGEERAITVGFARQAILGAAGKVVAAVKSGALRHLFLVGGCDGAKPGRNYYTEFAKAVPADCVILTLACGKYRFNKLDFGTLGGLPRLLDIGQCNDAYSAIQVALALAKAFGTDVNGLPLSLILSWYEQKAVAILLTLLHLGVKNIRLGPSLPAFVTPEVLQVLVQKFGIKPVTTPERDLAEILGGGKK